MKSKNPDRRVQKTRKLLHEALMSLVLEKRYESISVQEILDRANVGRSTFYAHFRDKDDLLEKGFEGMQELLRNAQGASASGTAKLEERMIGFSQAFFTHANEYRHVYTALMQSQAGPIMRQRIQSIIAGLIREECEGKFKRGKRMKSELPLELLIQYVSAVFLLVAAWWVDQVKPPSPESINTMFRSLVLPALESNFS